MAQSDREAAVVRVSHAPPKALGSRYGRSDRVLQCSQPMVGCVRIEGRVARVVLCALVWNSASIPSLTPWCAFQSSRRVVMHWTRVFPLGRQ